MEIPVGYIAPGLGGLILTLTPSTNGLGAHNVTFDGVCLKDGYDGPGLREI